MLLRFAECIEKLTIKRGRKKGRKKMRDLFLTCNQLTKCEEREREWHLYIIIIWTY